LGGASNSNGQAIAVDASGNTYVAGTAGFTFAAGTPGVSFPTTPNAAIPTVSSAATFAAKLSADGSKFLYVTFLPGSMATVNSSLADGMDCLFDIDYQGGRQIRRLWPAESVLCFILPPSMGELERRLRQRATDSNDVIERRLATAHEELTHYGEYDYLVVNDNLDQAYAKLRAIYVAASCVRVRNDALAQALLREAATRTSCQKP